jgi:HEAT repeat protein
MAALALGVAGSGVDGPRLLEIFGDERAPADLRKACAVAAGLTRARESSERFREILEATGKADIAAYGLVGFALVDGEAALPLARAFLENVSEEELRRRVMTALGYAGGKRAVEMLVRGLGDSYLVNREAARSLFIVDRERAVVELRRRLTESGDAFSRQFAADALGRALDPLTPTFFAESLLGAGLGFGTSIERVLLFLESRALYLNLPDVR